MNRYFQLPKEHDYYTQNSVDPFACNEGFKVDHTASNVKTLNIYSGTIRRKNEIRREHVFFILERLCLWMLSICEIAHTIIDLPLKFIKKIIFFIT